MKLEDLEPNIYVYSEALERALKALREVPVYFGDGDVEYDEFYSNWCQRHKEILEMAGWSLEGMT